MVDPRRRHEAFNASSRAQWEGFAPHRERLTSLLVDAAETGRERLCVLGAGNANDLDLPALLFVYREVHLVDLDRKSLALGAARQEVAEHPALRLEGGVDLTGMIDAFAGWTPRTALGPRDLEAVAEWPASRVAGTLGGPFDVVASTCLLSPLIGNAFQSVGAAHPRFDALVRAIRTGHLRLLGRLARPGGRVVLITDVVSTDALPELANVPEMELGRLPPRLAREGRHFFGLNPVELETVSRNAPGPGLRVAGFEALEPWRWSLHDRLYLVLAFRYRVEPLDR